jgi:hypothetical protein
LNSWSVFLVWEPDLFVLIQEIKPGFIQGYKIFPALVLDWTRQIQETFRCSDSGLFLCLR